MKRYILFICTVFASLCAYADETITVYTKCGQGVTGLILEEMTPMEIINANTDMLSNYPNAVYLASATNAYNCHGYAWNMMDGGPACWINATLDKGQSNLSKYWTSDYYMPTTEAKARKIYYYQSDHSAVPSEVPGMYESKWGAGPLMRHAPGYGPYPHMEIREYYGKAMKRDMLQCSNGLGETRVGVSSIYTPNPNNRFAGNVYCTWKIYGVRGEDADEKANIVIRSDIAASISFNTSGAYQIYATVYLKGTDEELGIYSFEALVL